MYRRRRRRHRPLVDTATSGRETVVIDGCPLECATQCLDHYDASPDLYYTLAREGTSKEYHADYDGAEAETLRGELETDIGEYMMCN